MATFLDVSGVAYFANIFAFIFVILIVFGVMAWTKIFGDNKFIYAMVAFFMGIFVLISPVSTDVIVTTAPILGVAILFAVLLNVALKMIGADLEGMQTFKVVFLVILIVIILVTVGTKVRDKVTDMQAKNELSSTLVLLLHPAFLGGILLFSVAIFTVAFLASKGGGPMGH